MEEHEEEPLDGALFAAFGRGPQESVLQAIGRLHGGGGSIFLRESAEVPAHIRIRRPGAAADGSRFKVLGEIARGGIGVVYQGFDVDLNRDVALKVLRPELVGNEDVIRRFIEEAQVGGQLQHPGIVPIYALTEEPDGRPSFAMKLVRGETLAALLGSNPKGIDLKAVFEQVAQTVAYAHSRGVIHRDLKPANVMVGAFGEVQVVDWGFAKVLGTADGVERRLEGQTLVATVRTDGEGSNSLAGSVMGTPAYMPPEQALGHVADMDERADVFALGAILCEILTGAPPYTGETSDQLVAASQCMLEDAHARLDACDAAPALVALVRDCLAPLRRDRPKDAGEVAQRLAGHFASVEERAREAEVGAAKARADAALAARSRGRSLVLASLTLLAVLVGGGGWVWIEHDAAARAERAAPRIAAALQEATAHEGRGDFVAAAAAAREAVSIAEAEGVDGARAASALAALEEEARRTEERERIEAEDQAFLTELEGLRRHQGSGTRDPSVLLPDHEGTDAAFAAAFEGRFGSVEASVERLAASRRAEDFAALVGYWSWTRRKLSEESGWQMIEQVARRIQPGHDDVRDALVAGDAEALLAIARERLEELPLVLAAQVARALGIRVGEHEASVEAFERLVSRAPSDFALNSSLSQAAREAGDLDLALQHATVALAVAPTRAHAWGDLATIRRLLGDHDEAVELARKAVALDAEDVCHSFVLADALASVGDLEGAIASYRRALELDPRNELARDGLADAERRLELKPALERLLDGREVDVTAAQRTILAEMLDGACEYELATEAYARAFDEDGALARDLDAGRRYRAACCAVLAGEARHDLALRWLRADLELWSELGVDPARLQRVLESWKRDPDLARIRDAANLDEGFEALWVDVHALLEEASR